MQTMMLLVQLIMLVRFSSFYFLRLVVVVQEVVLTYHQSQQLDLLLVLDLVLRLALILL